jgi:RNA polymerase sigma-70 factor (ECF subfamily)
MAMTHETLERLEVRYRAPLLRFFSRKLRRRADAEDLTQDVFVRLLRDEREDAHRSPDSYIFTIAINILRDHLRRKAVRQAYDDANGATIDFDRIEDLGPERVLLGKEALAIATAKLAALPARTRKMFLLFRFENMKQHEIAALYGLSISTVEKEIAKAAHAVASALAQGGAP